ncbi:hypothetical protein P3X46_028421 [Hevea brasiliensis]|uniref:Prolamin-like domain-containing protein n=1 Tax=Hevea brasiliensis TaxID=3981 RepID=A0ABQ9KQC2_HEVBR|nr:hypothetical protein P3X46_028421 [Hevea brasiliensis]
MVCILKLFSLIVLFACSMGFMAAKPLSPDSSLLARLKLDEDSTSCWDSLIQIQACSGEMILFFLNGETYLGHSCCNAIRTITKQCWPNMIDTLGFSTEESDILEGYCDRADDGSPPTPQATTLRGLVNYIH